MTIERTLLLASALALAACQPDLGATASEVSSRRILAVRATPAEAAPGTSVTYEALVVDASGDVSGAPIDWAFCNREKPLSDLNDVDEGCFTLSTEPFLTEIGVGSRASAMLPELGCSLFGPDVPPSMGTDPPGRPTDPDLTGGYYQPVRLILPDGAGYVLAAEESRIQCDLPAATPEAQAAYRMQYVANENPALPSLFAVVGGEERAIGVGGSAGRGKSFTLRATWPACPASGGCGAEAYVAYDASSQTLTTRREAITVSWYATGGSFASDSTGRTADDTTTSSDNTWTAPRTAGPITLWIVLRDDRGGSSWASYELLVE